MFSEFYVFCGFVIIKTPLKEKVEKYITELIKAKYDICIITGDHLSMQAFFYRDDDNYQRTVYNGVH